VADASTLVIGAGIVGLACAVEAQRRGRRVALVDHAEPGHGCSIGNAGIIAASEIHPLITPARVTALPRMLLSRDAPAVIRLASAPRVLPWFLRAARSLSAKRQAAIVDGLVALNRAAVPAWRDLLGACDRGTLLRENGMLRLIRDPRDRAALVATRDALAAHAMATLLLSGDEVRELEPTLGTAVIGGLLHETDADVADPLAVSRALLDRFLADGGTLIRERAEALRTGVLITDTGVHHATQILVTLGLDAAALLAPLGAIVPLQAERGYHLELDGCGDQLTRPVTFQRESCVATPMGGRLRLAGTVEFADAGAPPDWHRADRLAAHAAHYFDTPLACNTPRRWLGSRPSLPDSLPAIGRLGDAPGIGYAFGHQHLGVTQAAISAALLCDVMADTAPRIDPRPYDLARFG
jgi:D-hydroxyproline dehydrogenase